MMDQPSLFDEPIIEPVKIDLPLPDLDRLKQMIEPIDGEARVLDTRLGAWLGYTRDRDIRDLVKSHLVELARHGILRSYTANSRRRGRPATVFYLNHAQVNHLIIYCGLPHLSELRVLVTKVFTEWQQGHLVSTNVKTTIELEDGAAAAEEQAPGSVSLGAVMARVDHVEQVATEAFTVSHQALKLAQSRPMKYPGPATDDAPRAGDWRTWRPIRRGGRGKP